jgi:hypothetical protein
MLVLSAVEFGSAAWTPQQGNAYCPGSFLYKPNFETGESTHQPRREIETANMAVKITTKPEHPINRHLKNKKAYDQYGLRPSLTTLFFVRAKETCSMLEFDLKDVDQMVHPEYTPWFTNMEVNIDTTMLALPKGIEHTQN